MSKWRKVAAAAVAMLAMSGLAVATSTSGANALVFGTSSISGTITGPTGTPAFFIQVIAYQFDGTSWQPGTSTFTGFDGKYTLPSQPDGVPIEVEATPAFDRSVATQWFDNAADQASATAITLAPAEARVIDFQMRKAPAVVGTVTAPDGTPLDANITIYSPSTGASFGGQAFGGTFNVSVPAGTYVVYAATSGFPPDQYAPEYFGQSYSLAAATPIVVVAGGADVTGVDITLSPGAVVTGRILDDVGNPVPEGSVVMVNLNGPFGFDEFAHSSAVGPDGTYRLQGIPTGTFTYAFADGSASGLANIDIDLSTVAGQTLQHDVTLTRGAFGTVTALDNNGVMDNADPNNAPQVCQPDPTAATPTCAIGHFGLSAQPNPNGPGWIVGPLADGPWFAQLRSVFTGQVGEAVSLPSVLSPSFSCTIHFPGTPGTGSCQPAPALPVGTLSGHVTGPDGAGLAGVQVNAEYVVGSFTWPVPSAVFTDAFGDYSMANTWTGSYRVRFTPPLGRTDLNPAWWTSTGSAISANAGEFLTVQEGVTSTGIDGHITAAAQGTIQVTTAGQPSTPIPGEAVYFCHSPATAIPFINQCSDNSPPVTSFFDGTAFPTVALAPGSWTAQAFVSPFSRGSVAAFDVGVGDSFSCSLDTLSTGPSSCTVAGATPPDTTPPLITPTVSPTTPDGNNGWYRSDVSVHFQVDEPESPASLTTTGCADVSVTADQPATTYSCTASSAGGNAGPVDVTIQRDATAPTVSWTSSIADGSSFVFGSVPAAPTCAAVDALSGPNDCTVQGYSTAVGTHTLVATATDQAGNMGSASITYTVTPYRLVGFRAPVRPSPFVNFLDAGDDVRFQWQVFAGATELKSTSAISSFTATPASCVSWIPSGAAAVDLTVGNPVIRDLKRGVFSLKWEPTRRQRGCWLVTMTTDDGSSLTARFRVK